MEIDTDIRVETFESMIFLQTQYEMLSYPVYYRNPMAKWFIDQQPQAKFISRNKFRVMKDVMKVITFLVTFIVMVKLYKF